MRLSSTLFRSRSLAQAPQGPLDPPAGEAGAESYELYSDLMGGGPDVNPELTGHLKQLVYDEMRKTDPTIKSLLWFFQLPIRSANWGLEPRTTDPAAQVIRDFVAWNLGLEDDLGAMSMSWEQTIAQALEMMTWGAMFEELVWDDLQTWTDADGDQHQVVPLARLAPRRPVTVEKLERDGKGNISALRQRIPGAKPIPASKLSYLCFEPESGAWDGVSVLRPAWLAWRLKKALMISAGIGWDRFAMGLPVVWHPDNPAAEQVAKNIGRSIRSHERAYVHFPIPDGMTKDEAGWALDIVNASSTLADPTPLIKLCSDQEAEAGLQQFARQGLSTTGARATSETQVEPFLLAVEAVAGYVRRERMRQVIRRIVQINFGDQAAQTYTPILTVNRIIAQDIETISKAIHFLAPAGFTFTDRGAQDDIRELLGMPKLPADDLATVGISQKQLIAILQGLGLDSETFAEIVAALPPELGIARNIAPPAEGDPLAA